MEDRTGTNSEGKDFDYKVMVINELEYRVPATVLEEIQKDFEVWNQKQSL